RRGSLPGGRMTVARDGFRASRSPTKPQRDWTAEIRHVMQLLQDARADEHSVILVIDEFEKVAEIDSALPNLVKSLTDSELRGVGLVMSGSRRHVMHELYAGPGAPLLGVGEMLTLHLVPEADMTAFLLERTRSGGKDMTNEGAALLFARARGVPAYVQRLAFEAFESVDSVIDEAAVERAVAT